ncbi:MAG: RRXRR domain-containing protein [Victivallales bacterium]|nr:RRXRR domain-containing protein [Victivallales bacterium]
MTPVFVLSMNGTKLMPTTRLGRVRHLLKDGKAEIACRKPFTIRLLYPSTEYVQYLELGVDSGYENVGLSLKTERRELMSSELRSWQTKNPAMTTAAHTGEHAGTGSATASRASTTGNARKDGSRHR